MTSERQGEKEVRGMTMIERVARALCTRSLHGVISIETAVEKGWPRWVPLARVAIAAMREPTREVANAIDAAGRDPGLIVANWYRMIDAALGELRGAP